MYLLISALTRLTLDTNMAPLTMFSAQTFAPQETYIDISSLSLNHALFLLKVFINTKYYSVYLFIYNLSWSTSFVRSIFCQYSISHTWLVSDT